MERRPHIDKRYEEELAALQQKVLTMGGVVEKQVADSVEALITRSEDLARATIDGDKKVNSFDVEIDEDCFRLLALHQPTARDLRLITTALKITTDLERAGDMAVNICERALELDQEPPVKPFIDIRRMTDLAQRMLRESLDAFVREDADLALKVCQDDDEVDSLTTQVFRELISFMMEEPKIIGRALRITFVAKYLERIADHATNISEMVIFMVKGKTIRHLDELPREV